MMETHPIKTDELGILEIRTYGIFVLSVNDRIVGPDNASDRFFKTAVTASDVVEIHTDQPYQTKIKVLPYRNEHPDPNSLCEIIDESELSMFDRLRAEMHTLVTGFADDKDKESYEDSQDLDFEEEDPLIDTPYEYQAMEEEFLPDQPQPQKEPETPSLTEPPTVSEQPESLISE